MALGRSAGATLTRGLSCTSPASDGSGSSRRLEATLGSAPPCTQHLRRLTLEIRKARTPDRPLPPVHPALRTLQTVRAKTARLDSGHSRRPGPTAESITATGASGMPAAFW